MKSFLSLVFTSISLTSLVRKQELFCSRVRGMEFSPLAICAFEKARFFELWVGGLYYGMPRKASCVTAGAALLLYKQGNKDGRTC